MFPPEQTARQPIDAQLGMAGWGSRGGNCVIWREFADRLPVIFMDFVQSGCTCIPKENRESGWDFIERIAAHFRVL
jgi:hypothetical protein